MTDGQIRTMIADATICLDITSRLLGEQPPGIHQATPEERLAYLLRQVRRDLERLMGDDIGATP